MLQLSNELYEFISYVFGCSSVLIWVCAQFPQIMKNYRKKSVEGISPGFLLAWIAGDTSNLVGCLLTGQLGVQVLLASYFCIIDVILIFQFNLYKETPDEVLIVHGVDPYEDPDGNDNSNHLVTKRRTSSMAKNICMTLSSMLTATTTIGRTSAAPITEPFSTYSSTLSRSTLLSFPLFTALESGDWTTAVGYFVAYISMFMYLTSRVPQIYHNYQRKSTTGISMFLFIFALMGNTTYILSIVLSPQCIGRDADTQSFLVKEFSYLAGAFGTILFDCIILGQWHWYQRVYPRRRRSTAPYDRIQRPYLGGERVKRVVILTPRPCSTPTIEPHDPETELGSPPSMSLLSNTQVGSPGYGSTDESALI